MNKLLFASAASLLLCACAANEPLDTSMGSASPTWVAVQTGTGSDGLPLTTVKLVKGDINNVLYGANCEGIISPVEIGGAETAVRCWWAGGGADFAAFKNGTGYLVRTRWVDEESGYGPWETAK